MARRSKGEGTLIELPDGRWRARITVDGTRVTRDRSSRAEAEAALKTLRSGAAVGVVPTSATVHEWITHWLAHVADIAPTTRAGYDVTLRTHIAPHIGRVKLADLKPEQIERLYTLMRTGTYAKPRTLKNGKTWAPKPLSGATIHITHALLHKTLRVAEQRGLVVRNVAALVEPPRGGGARVTTLSTENTRRVLRQAMADGEGARWSLALMLGLRPGEALGLSWDCLDGDRLHVRQQLQQVSGQGVTLRRLPKSHAGFRTLPLPDAIVAMLDAQRRQQEDWIDEEGPDWLGWTPPGEDMPVSMVFTDRTGHPIRPRLDGTHWERLLQRAGVPHTRRYSARHTAASLLIAEGIDVSVVADRLGHADSSFTMRTYVHPMDERQRAANDALERLLNP